MANFTKRPGSAGTWSESQSLLTIHLGETAEIIQWGGGPSGPLILSYGATMPCTGGEDTKAPLGPNERLLKITPQETGEISVFARVGSSTGPEYAAPAKVVVLPRKASSIGPEHVILFSGKDGETIQEAYNKLRSSGPNTTVYGTKSLSDFSGLLSRYRNDGRRISQLEVNSHGTPGSAWLGSEALNASSMLGMKGKFQAAFSPGAAVFFHGCNIAQGTDGNAFLVAFGETFLGGGGSVGANTSVGLGTGNWGNGKVYHLWGSTKRVLVAPGGRVVEKINFDQ